MLGGLSSVQSCLCVFWFYIGDLAYRRVLLFVGSLVSLLVCLIVRVLNVLGLSSRRLKATKRGFGTAVY